MEDACFACLSKLFQTLAPLYEKHFCPFDVFFFGICTSDVICVFTFPLRLLSSQVFSVGSKIGCNNIAGLVKSQRTICSQYPKLMLKVGDGAAKALRECQQQFAFSRWNCPVNEGTSGRLMSKGDHFLQCLSQFCPQLLVIIL